MPIRCYRSLPETDDDHHDDDVVLDLVLTCLLCLFTLS